MSCRDAHHSAACHDKCRQHCWVVNNDTKVSSHRLLPLMLCWKCSAMQGMDERARSAAEGGSLDGAPGQNLEGGKGGATLDCNQHQVSRSNRVVKGYMLSSKTTGELTICCCLQSLKL